jgi:hypothetical protein
MQLDCPDGVLTLDDDTLTYAPKDNGPTLTASLSPVPDWHFERGIYGTGALVIAGQYIPVRNDDAEAVATELRRERKASAKPATRRTDSDEATAK